VKIGEGWRGKSFGMTEVLKRLVGGRAHPYPHYDETNFQDDGSVSFCLSTIAIDMKLNPVIGQSVFS
jgi:hypothetical protein